MNCPHCGAQHDPETAGRFCNNCGMSVIKLAPKPAADDTEKEQRTIRCRGCGVESPPPRCVACGGLLPIPDDWEDWEEE